MRTQKKNNIRARLNLFTLSLMLLALLVAGCGYRGPLYLPDEPPPQTDQATAEAPDDEEEDGDSLR